MKDPEHSSSSGEANLLRDSQNRLEANGYFGPHKFYWNATSRNRGLLSLDEQERLRRATVALPGMGGVGGEHLITLVRTGVGRFHLSDFDRFEVENVNRQFGATVPDLNRPKLEVMEEQARRVNPYLDIETFPEGVKASNLDAFLDGVDVVVDSLDAFNIQTRRLLFRRARQRGIPVLTAGPIGFSAVFLAFLPDQGMGFDEYFDIHDGMDVDEQFMRFIIGVAPKSTHRSYLDFGNVDLGNRTGPSLGLSCKFCAAVAATEVVRIVLDRGHPKPAPHYRQYDLHDRKFVQKTLRFGNRNPIQKLKLFVLRRLIAQGDDDFWIGPPARPVIDDGPRVTPEILTYALQAGKRAPSGDNVQPWRFSKGERSVRVYLDRTTTSSALDVARIASLVACGTAVENITLAGSYYGLEAEVSTPDVLEDGDRAEVAQIAFRPTGWDEDPLHRFIWDRHTNRSSFDGRPIPEAHLRELAEAATHVPDASLDLYTERSEIQDIAELVERADLIRAWNRELHEAFIEMVRFSDDEALETRDGFHIKNLEAGRDGELFLKTARSWSAMNVMNKIGMGRLIAKESKEGILESSAVGLLRAGSTDAEDVLAGGRALERIWLAATRLGIDVQPFAAITFFWMRWKLDMTELFSRPQKQHLEKLWPDYNAFFGTSFEDDETHIMLLRFGYGQEIEKGTLRKKLSELKI